MGFSYNFRQPVFTVINQYFLFTLVFSLVSFTIQIITSIWLSALVMRKKSLRLDRFMTNTSLLFYSIPAFVLGVGLIYIFSVGFNLFPFSGLNSIDYDNFSFISKILDTVHHMVLPLITVSAAGIAMFYKYIKESMDEVNAQVFVLNLRASGMNEKIILKKHIIPNALRPLLSVAGVELGILLGGTLITEIIFSLPGMGRLTVDSILSRDYPLVIGCVFTAGSIMIAANFLADIIKLKIDRRLLKGLLN